MVGIAPSPDSTGYWIVASDGGIFTFGDAASTGPWAPRSTSPWWVWPPPRRAGTGWWRRTAGSSPSTTPFLGSTGAVELTKPVVAMVATPDGRGYWLFASDGGMFAFGDAEFYGSPAA